MKLSQALSSPTATILYGILAFTFYLLDIMPIASALAGASCILFGNNFFIKYLNGGKIYVAPLKENIETNIFLFLMIWFWPLTLFAAVLCMNRHGTFRVKHQEVDEEYT